MSLYQNIEIITAPSILGLKPTGVEHLAESLLASGLADELQIKHPVIYMDTLNSTYSNQRDSDTKCLNSESIKKFSINLGKIISDTINRKHFPLVLGGDCSILIGIMPALKTLGKYGLVFMDAHADFYEPEKSVTGEVADMDLAIVTGRGPDLLTNIDSLKPYVEDENVMHIGQRDQEETEKYNSQDIRKTEVKCFGYQDIKVKGIKSVTHDLLTHLNKLNADRFWIHFDTDVLDDKINPAVDYRLPGGISFQEAEFLLCELLKTNKMAGISVTIFNPQLDPDKIISKNITTALGKAFEL